MQSARSEQEHPLWGEADCCRLARKIQAGCLQLNSYEHIIKTHQYSQEIPKFNVFGRLYYVSSHNQL